MIKLYSPEYDFMDYTNIINIFHKAQRGSVETDEFPGPIPPIS